MTEPNADISDEELIFLGKQISGADSTLQKMCRNFANRLEQRNKENAQLREQLHLANVDCANTEAENAELKEEISVLKGLNAVLGKRR